MKTSNTTGITFGKRFGFWLGIVLFIIMLSIPTNMNPEAQRTAAVTLLIATWWISVCIPIPITSLIPLIAFPALGIMKSSETASFYANNNIFLFMGGFFIALAIQKWNLHKRIALRIVDVVGVNQRMIILGFMIASAFLSMWISNTATTLMMLPIGLAIVHQITKIDVEESGVIKTNFAKGLMLAIAYSASVGGIATPIGTPPNIEFMGQYSRMFPGAPEINFFSWLKIFVPLEIIFIPLIWLIITRITCPLKGEAVDSESDVIKEELEKLGKMSKGERYTLIIFLTTAALWIFRVDINLGFFTIPGWSNIFPNKAYLHDATVAMFMSSIMYIIPVDRKKGEYLLDWEWGKKIPWGILLLFGGGFAIAGAFRSSGLSEEIGNLLQFLSGVPPIILVASTCLLLTFLTEITSNTATTAVMLPIMAAISKTVSVNPLLLMLPATIAASCAFMLPVATPPNAIVFGSGHISMYDMVKTGIIINLIGIVLVAVVIYLIAVPVLGISFTEYPSWAN